MTVDIRYEMIEYGKVLFGYVFLMWVWPSVVFYRHLSRTRSCIDSGVSLSSPSGQIRYVPRTRGSPRLSAAEAFL